jgi:hypothetical protein
VSIDGGHGPATERGSSVVRFSLRFGRFFVKHYERPLERNRWFWSAVIFAAFTCGWSSAEGDPLIGLLSAGVVIYWVGIAEHVLRSVRDGLRDEPRR